MKRVFWALFFAATAAGSALPFLPGGSWPWWDPAWGMLFFVAAYADLAGSAGLSAARLASGIVVVAMAVLLGVSGLTGWPCGPLQFTAHAGLRLGGAVPLVLPLLAFALLASGGRAATAAFPGAGRTGHAAATAAAFIVSVANGLALFVPCRIWWVWNPLGQPGAAGRAAFALLFLAAAAFALAFTFPPDTRLKTGRWNPGLAAWLAANALFLAANFAMLPK